MRYSEQEIALIMLTRTLVLGAQEMADLEPHRSIQGLKTIDEQIPVKSRVRLGHSHGLSLRARNGAEVVEPLSVSEALTRLPDRIVSTIT